MGPKAVRLLKWGAVVLAVTLVTVLAVRAYDSQRGPPLELWHTFVPHEIDGRRRSTRRTGRSTSRPRRRSSPKCAPK